MEFKCIHDIPHIKNINYPLDIMGVVFNTEVHFDDTAWSKMGSWRGDFGPQDVENPEVYKYFDDDDKWLETKGRLSDFRFNPVCRRLRSSGNHYLTVTLMFGDMGAMRPL
uniref:Uncharacterized protein n=1 Tax=Brassica campestris TaxID=3711 RepID=A0A3P5Z4K8_BRACM|nr:unnamed protein product [Brassica rapa]